MAGRFVRDQTDDAVMGLLDPINGQAVNSLASITTSWIDPQTTIVYSYAPEVTEDYPEYMTRAGKMFSVTTGFNTLVAVSGNYGLSIFNPSTSGKTIEIFDCRVTWNNGTIAMILARTTTDPAYSNTLTPYNLSFDTNAPASVLTTTITYTSSAVSAPGTAFSFLLVPSNTMPPLIQPKFPIILPAGQAKGLAAYGYFSGGGGYWGMTLTYAER